MSSRLLPRLLRRLLKLLLAAALLSALLVLSLRWIPPVGSALMVERKVESWLDGKPIDLQREWRPWPVISARNSWSKLLSCSATVLLAALGTKVHSSFRSVQTSRLGSISSIVRRL